MCGIVSLCYGSLNSQLGVEGGELLKRLEYRGYDSTGGAFVGSDQSITLLKSVGAPSKVVPALGIDKQQGERFIGQVRWATYGSVTQENCQPHTMTCKMPFLGAHNGNISNTDSLKVYLAEHGHTVLSDNDGEMITHLTEDFYDAAVAAGTVISDQGFDVPASAMLLIDAARRADAMAEGSYAAAYCDPNSAGIVAVKSGSSLYAGIGHDDAGDFVVVSSDLTSVLSKTSDLIPLIEGQGLWYTENRYVVFTLGGELELSTPEPKKSTLNVADTSLRPGFDYYMAQEIASAPENIDEVIAGYLNEGGVAVTALEQLVADLAKAQQQGGRVYFLACGTSYHAAMTGAGFFNSMAHLPVFPCNPGLFRSMYLDSLTDKDVVFAITQSGETKDIVDVLVDVHERHEKLVICSLVNNENSRIPQELSAYYLPLLCGPEIAVPATKSFISQLAILYIIAGALGGQRDVMTAQLNRGKELIENTLVQANVSLDAVAKKLFHAPSMHILGASLTGVAMEGSLKIREVVLNHTQGYDVAEFKHGPNTILGKNTLFSLADMAAAFSDATVGKGELSREELAALVEERFSNYPLIFVCPPDERDIRITISQIHTHKIRGAHVVVIAEENDELRKAAEGVPAGIKDYWSTFVALPESGDANLFTFSSSVALQHLAYRMAELKMEYLDRLGVIDHGVHPDSPKNVSKSVTVD
ncbi:MAG: SIS domain-containing protein [Propionibacteriaceae bacterium]